LKKEGLPPDGGFLVANTYTHLSHGHIRATGGCSGPCPLYVRQQSRKGSMIVLGLLAVKSCRAVGKQICTDK